MPQTKELNLLLTKATIAIRRKRPVVPSDFTWAKWVEKDYAYIYFRTRGCRYSLMGECTMCDYWTCEQSTPEEMVGACADALASLSKPPKVLQITALGSMLDEKEVPGKARREIWKLAATSGSEIYICETRPETVTPYLIREMAGTLGHMCPGIEMGLESASPWVQRFSLNKNSLAYYERAVRIASEQGIQTYANVLLGPPFLSEKESIENAVATIRWAFAKGTDYCVLFPVHVKAWTLAHWLWERNEYQSPSLWSLIEVLHLIGTNLAASTFIAWYRPQYSEVDRRYGKYSASAPTTCPACEHDVLSILDRYRENEDYRIIESLRLFPCRCRQEWRIMVWDQEAEDRRQRAARLYDLVGYELLPPATWSAMRDRELAKLFEVTA
jgi:hypothetical protein